MSVSIALPIGIDLGTTNSCVAVVKDGKPKVLDNTEGDPTTPSVVAYLDDNESVVGINAKRQAVTNPDNTFYAFKRLIGRKYLDSSIESLKLGYKVAKGNNSDAWVHCPKVGKDKSPSELSAMVLQKMKSTAEAYLGAKVTDAVVTVPAYFNDAQRQATKDAGTIAGLNIKRIINEPTAAALAYGLDKSDSDLKIAVFDLGGGTFDVSVLELGGGVFEVKATGGDSALGGEDCDAAILNMLVGEFKKNTGIDLSKDLLALQRLKEAAEKAKIELSGSSQSEINLPFLAANQSGPQHLSIKLTKSMFEELILKFVDKCMKITNKVLAESGFKKEEIDEVIMVGGSTRIPMVQDKVQALFGKRPNRSVNPDEVVAMGAAIQADILCGGSSSNLLLLDVTPLSIGIETVGGVCTKLIPKNTTIPVKKSQTFSTAADSQPEVAIKVLQGEREMAADNRLLGTFALKGIPPAPRGVPQIEVSFDVDANGIMNVSAKDLGTSKECNIRIDSSGGLSKDEIERMTKDAATNEEADKKRRELVEARNNADSLIYSTEKTISELGNKVSSEDKAEAEKSIAELREVLGKDDIEAINSANDTLTKISHKLSTSLYQDNTASSSPSEDSSSSGDSEKVVDSDYEECNDDDADKKD